MSRAPATAALGVGVLLVANPLYVSAYVAATLPEFLVVAQGSLALFGVLAAVAGWFGRDTDSLDWLLWAFAGTGVALAAVPFVGVGVGVLGWALVVAMAALVGGLPATVLLFRASRWPHG